MSKSDFEVISFDFDGVLADTIGAHTQARMDAMVKMSELSNDSRFADITLEQHNQAHSHGSTPPAIIGWLLVEAGIARNLSDPMIAEVVALKNQLYWEHAKKGLEAVDGVLPFVQRSVVHFAGNLAMVTTASVHSEVSPFLKHHDLEGVFKVIIGKEDVGKNALKPHPAAYRAMLRRMNRDRNRSSVIAVEDSPYGIQSARGAKVPVVGITTTHSAEAIKSADHSQQPDYIVNNFEELAQLLNYDQIKPA